MKTRSGRHYGCSKIRSGAHYGNAIGGEYDPDEVVFAGQ